MQFGITYLCMCHTTASANVSVIGAVHSSVSIRPIHSSVGDITGNDVSTEDNLYNKVPGF